MGFFQFEFLWAWWAGLPLLAIVLVLVDRNVQVLSRGRRLILGGLRALALLAILGLIARPVWVREDPSIAKRPLVLLLDRSQSMSLTEHAENRYQLALGFLRQQLLPALKSAGINSEAILFAREANLATAQEVVDAKPDGDQTNLGNAIEQALSGRIPAGIVALTDGVSNQSAANHRALAGLLEAGIPFFGIGFGTEQGASTLNLRRLDIPPVVPPKQKFSLGVQMEATTTGQVPEFALSLFRDGQLVETRKVAGFSGSRFWLETFSLKEDEEGAHQYLARFDLPADSKMVVANASASADVQVSAEKEFRVLFAQGALTWDFKFIARALEEDPTVKLTGLSRTSEHSIFRQNVEIAGELLNGFPEKLEEIAGFRVVVLSDLNPADFNPAQQETLAKFCRELGGGVLLLGGAGSFGPEWAGSQLEQLLPVKFDSDLGVHGLDQPFHLQLTAEGFGHPAFQISSPGENRQAWQKLPAFTQYGRVSAAKPGAVVLAEHERDLGPGGRRILMAAQRYGAGQSAVICVQNFWRWRLAKDSESGQFERFWRQFLRWLGETSRKPYEISFPAQDLGLDKPSQFIVERLAGGESEGMNEEARVEVIGPGGEPIFSRPLQLSAGKAEAMEFVARKAGLFRVRVVGALERELASRSLEVKTLNVEFQQTARDMEGLHQWAGMTQGLASKVEECESRGMLEQIVSRVKLARDARRERLPLGLNAGMLALILGSLSLEWILRRNWKLR